MSGIFTLHWTRGSTWLLYVVIAPAFTTCFSQGSRLHMCPPKWAQNTLRRRLIWSLLRLDKIASLQLCEQCLERYPGSLMTVFTPIRISTDSQAKVWLIVA